MVPLVIFGLDCFGASEQTEFLSKKHWTNSPPILRMKEVSEYMYLYTVYLYIYICVFPCIHIVQYIFIIYTYIYLYMYTQSLGANLLIYIYIYIVFLYHAHIWQLVFHRGLIGGFLWRPQVFKQLRPDPSIMQALLGWQTKRRVVDDWMVVWMWLGWSRLVMFGWVGWYSLLGLGWDVTRYDFPQGSCLFLGELVTFCPIFEHMQLALILDKCKDELPFSCFL